MAPTAGRANASPGLAIYRGDLWDMHIQIEATPNPEALKFLPGQVVNPGAAADFTASSQAAPGSLAADLLDLGDVARVHIGFDFVSVSRRGNADWATLRPRVVRAIAEHIEARGRPMAPGRASPVIHAPDDADVVSRIHDALEIHIRPAIARDGGGITLVRFEDGIAHLRLEGACSGCPDAGRTLGEGVARLLRNTVAEVRGVRAAPG